MCADAASDFVDDASEIVAYRACIVVRGTLDAGDDDGLRIRCPDECPTIGEIDASPVEGARRITRLIISAYGIGKGKFRVVVARQTQLGRCTRRRQIG